MNRLVLLGPPGSQRLIDLGPGTPQQGTAELPFASTSVWRLAIAQSATFAAANDARNTSIHNTGADGSGLVWINSDQYSLPVSYSTVNDPLATITDTFHGGTWQDRIPSTARIAAGTDGNMLVIEPDRSQVLEFFRATRVDPTHYTVERRVRVDLAGSGIGPNNGVRAYGGSALGGLIRGWEVDPNNSKYTGVIRHPLAIALRASQLFKSGSAGYVWPATTQDGDSATSYSGVIPMGSYFAIPPSVDITSLGLQTPQGLMLARAAQDYGCYVTDRSGTQAFYCEDDAGPAKAFADALLGGGSYSAHDPRVVFNALSVVTNNGSSTPNGGPPGAARRA